MEKGGGKGKENSLSLFLSSEKDTLGRIVYQRFIGVRICILNMRSGTGC